MLLQDILKTRNIRSQLSRPNNLLILFPPLLQSPCYILSDLVDCQGMSLLLLRVAASKCLSTIDIRYQLKTEQQHMLQTFKQFVFFRIHEQKLTSHVIICSTKNASFILMSCRKIFIRHLSRIWFKNTYIGLNV
jgi:hypothetical protein